MLILTRTACLGGEVTNSKIGSKHEYYNQQKVRVDMFLDIVNDNNKKPKFDVINSWLKRKDMAGVYSQSEKLEWLNINSKPDYLIMDNYSELTDKKFIDKKEGWEFCGLYGDLDSDLCNDKLEHLDLLDVNKIEEQYDSFFSYVKKRWDVPIIFIHFPTTFETREQYINQGQAITNALNILAPKYNIQNIHADLEFIEQKDCDVYHFTQKTIDHMASKIKI